MLSVLDDLRQMRAVDVVVGVAGSMRSVAFGKIEAKMTGEAGWSGKQRSVDHHG
jgi:hypothetical protein